MTGLDTEYLLEHLVQANVTPYAWDGEDRNIAAFRSVADIIAWYIQSPGIDGHPYRDRGFYTRELAMLSRVIQPRTIVEFGTSLGIGTCLLHWLNPTAKLITVDVVTETFMPGDRRVSIGHLARHNKIPCEFVTMPSWEYKHKAVDLCFIDADHSYEAVLKDSETAWENRAVDHPSAIAWHDYNSRHLGVVQAVYKFCAEKGVKLQSREDSDTVWI